MNIKRILQDELVKKLHRSKAIILLGARQVGKTFLLNELCDKFDNYLWLNADEEKTRHLFDDISTARLKTIIGQHKVVIIDEAQRITNIGIKLKLITDQIKDVQLIATGSSSFDLANKINEPLTGRKFDFQLFPISFEEMVNHHGMLDEMNLLEHRLVYGYYPDVINDKGNEQEVLNTLTNSYLYKDIFIWNKIKKSDKIVKLLQAIALQLGNQVSYNELGQIIGLDSQTVESYINILEQSFIIFRLTTFSRNLRNELKASRKIYFYDNGIRNAIISNYNPIALRNDVGALWENFLISERMKYTSYHKIYHNRFFWRTQAQQEIDYLEEREGKIFAYEFKWNPRVKVKFPKSFINSYPDSETKVISQDNYEEFVMAK
ncbi:MAG: ATPase [Bacteroidetes bacterium]|nr:MAG: ATPase [Bacteroidota bacterium]